jgi:hypothetical protein
MKLFHGKLHLRPALGALLMSIFLISALAYSQEMTLSNVTPTPTPSGEDLFAKLASQRRKPIPLIWKVAIVLGVVAVCSGALWLSMRVWRASNLFDRQYYLPPVTTAALRLDGKRSGGHMAVITFHERAGPHNGT